MLLSDADNIIDDAMGVLPSQDPRTLNGTIQHVLSSANDTMSRVYQLELELNRKSGELEETVRKYETVQADLQDLHSALQASQTEAEAANELAMTLEERVDMLQKSLDAAQSETVKYKKAFEDSSIEAKAASELADALKENTSLLEQSIEALKKELAELQEKYKTSQKDLVSTNELATGLKAKVESLENFLQEKEESLDDVQVTEALLAAKVPGVHGFEKDMSYQFLNVYYHAHIAYATDCISGRGTRRSSGADRKLEWQQGGNGKAFSRSSSCKKQAYTSRESTSVC